MSLQGFRTIQRCTEEDKVSIKQQLRATQGLESQIFFHCVQQG